MSPPTEFDVGDFGLGGIVSPPDQRDHAVSLDEAIVLPRRLLIGPPATKYSMAPVTNQGQLPQCGGYTAKDVKAYECKVEGLGVPNLDPHWAYFHAQARDGIPLPHDGTTGRAILETLRVEGIQEVGKPGSAPLHRIGSYGALPFTAAAIKRAIVQYQGPVVIGMAWPESFFRPVNGVMPAPSAQIAGGHLLETMGYDDDVAGGSALLQNHWTTRWGIGGRAWVPFRYLLALVHDLYKVLDAGISVRP